MQNANRNKKSNAMKVDKDTSTSDPSYARNNKNNKNSKKSPNNNSQKEQNGKNIKKEPVKDNLTLLKEKTQSLKLNLTTLQLYLDEERNNSIKDSHILNAKIKEINNEINRLKVDNKYLTKCFNSLNKRLCTEVNQAISNRIKNKNNNSINIEENLNKNIKLKEKMILNNKYSLKIIMKEKKRLANEIKVNDDPDRKGNLEKKLEEIKMTQENKMKEIEELKMLKSEHISACARKISELLRQYDLLKKEYDFERKKNNISLISQNKNLSKSTKNIKTEIIEDSKEKNNNNSVKDQTSKDKKKIRNLFKQYFKLPREKKKKKDVISIKDYAFLYNNSNNPITPNYSNDINNNKNESKLYKNNERKINKSFNYSNKTLFTKSEKIFLSKLIPDKCLDNYEHKFNSLINQTLNIKSKIVNYKDKSNNDINKNLIKLENSSLQNNISHKNMVKLKSKVNEYHRKRRRIIEKIELNEKDLKYYNMLYNRMNYDYKVLVQYFKDFYEQIQDRKYVLIQGEQLTQENINAMDKYGMRGSNNTSIDGFNEDVDYANVSEYENEEIEDEKEENEHEHEDNETK